MRRLFRNREGSSTVDFAFAAPVLVTLMLGTVQMGVSFHSSGALRHAAGEGVRLAKVDPSATDAEVIARVKSELPTMDPDKITKLTFQRGTTNGADYGEVTIEYRVDPIIPLLPVPPVTLSETKKAWLPQ